MTGHDFTLNGADLTARASGALWWAGPGMLVVSDLHLGKSVRAARLGGALLPPYESRATLDRLAAEIAATAPRTVLCLGDSFDDLDAAGELDEGDSDRLSALMAGRRWIWIAGNHDAAPVAIGGEHRGELVEGPLTFRHIARTDAGPGEVSGHYHPKMRLATRAGRVSRPCFLADRRRLVLPAFGAYTGGLSARDDALAGLFGPDAIAIMTGTRCAALPLAG